MTQINRLQYMTLLSYKLKSLLQQDCEEIKYLQQQYLPSTEKKDIQINLFDNINIYENLINEKTVEVEKTTNDNVDADNTDINQQWGNIEKQIRKSLKDYSFKNQDEVYAEIQKEKEAKQLTQQIDDYSSGKIDEDELLENLSEEEYENLEAELAQEKYLQEQQEEIKRLQAKFHRREHPEETLPEFKDYLKLSDYQITPYIHVYKPKDDDEPKDYIHSHLAFISDFFPVNNRDVSFLIRNVRRTINENFQDANILADQLNELKTKEYNSIIDIYCFWLKYLQQQNIDFYQYDWRNFNDAGEFIDNQQHSDLKQLINSYKQHGQLYDEVADKEKAEHQFQKYVTELLNSGDYHSSIDPTLGQGQQRKVD